MKEPEVILFNKPYRVLTQFSPSGEKMTLASFIPVKGVYAAGRLDYDSEGLLLLTDNGPLQHLIAHPREKLPKTYLAQVEGTPSSEALENLARGVLLKDGMTAPAKVILLPQPPQLWDRTPPIRYRAQIPTSWLSITISEGRNRQVRRMTAAVALPTLRLVRTAIGPWQLGDIKPGEWQTAKVPSSILRKIIGRRA